MRWLRVLVTLVVIAAAYPAWLAYRVWDQSHRDENRTVDAIVVLGAAQYDGRPSPVFRARLNHAAYLYNEGFSETVVVTGGKQLGDRFTEGDAGRRYLVPRTSSWSRTTDARRSRACAASARSPKARASRRFCSSRTRSTPSASS